MNEHLRLLLNNQIKKALADSEVASLKKHPYLIGKVREILLDTLINPLLNKNYSSGTGHVVDCNGNQSHEMDICIYSNNILSPFVYSSFEKLGMFPIESVLNCIEVKSTFSKSNLKDAFEKFQHFSSKLMMSSCLHQGDMPLPHLFSKPEFSFFAFDADVVKYKPEYILSIYKEIDPLWEEKPLITSICIANKGWMCCTNRGWCHMSYNHKSKINEEIISFLSTLLHGLDRTAEGRGVPRIGYYLSNGFELDKLVNGKKVRNTWRNKQVSFSNTDIDKLKTYTATIL